MVVGWHGRLDWRQDEDNAFVLVAGQRLHHDKERENVGSSKTV